MYNVTMEAKAGGENKMDKVISTIQWSRDDIEYLLKDNGYEGNTQQIEQFIENFDIEYFEEKCIECEFCCQKGNALYSGKFQQGYFPG